MIIFWSIYVIVMLFMVAMVVNKIGKMITGAIETEGKYPHIHEIITGGKTDIILYTILVSIIMGVLWPVWFLIFIVDGVITLYFKRKYK